MKRPIRVISVIRVCFLTLTPIAVGDVCSVCSVLTFPTLWKSANCALGLLLASHELFGWCCRAGRSTSYRQSLTPNSSIVLFAKFFIPYFLNFFFFFIKYRLIFWAVKCFSYLWGDNYMLRLVIRWRMWRKIREWSLPQTYATPCGSGLTASGGERYLRRRFICALFTTNLNLHFLSWSFPDSAIHVSMCLCIVGYLFSGGQMFMACNRRRIGFPHFRNLTDN